MIRDLAKSSLLLPNRVNFNEATLSPETCLVGRGGPVAPTKNPLGSAEARLPSVKDRPWSNEI